MGRFIGIACALGLLLLALVVDALFFAHDGDGERKPQEVELVASAEPEPPKEEKKEVVEKREELKTEAEKPPDAAEILKNLDLDALQPEPELEAASLSAISDALNGLAAGSADFGETLSFASGGRIGGTGKASARDDALDQAFSLSEIDQKPRAVYQAAPLYPSEMRGKKVEGLVSLIFVVDSNGKVSSPRVEKSSHRAFERPALDAVRQWKFEPALKGGQRVSCKMRVPIRFQQPN